jgi:uncharacterized membrane protein YeaQ/YmgE (transglycosylase-associated protein family)
MVMAALRKWLCDSAACNGAWSRMPGRPAAGLDSNQATDHDPPLPRGGHAMGIESLIVFILIGAIAGWLAGQLVKGYGFGLIGNIAVGIVGAFIAGFLFPALGLSLGGGVLAAIIHATIGAVILLVVIKLVRQA